jgi:hypothetical protein
MSRLLLGTSFQSFHMAVDRSVVDVNLIPVGDSFSASRVRTAPVRCAKSLKVSSSFPSLAYQGTFARAERGYPPYRRKGESAGGKVLRNTKGVSSVNLSAARHAALDGSRALSAADFARLVASVLHDSRLACPEVYLRPGIRRYDKRSGDNEYEGVSRRHFFTHPARRPAA